MVTTLILSLILTIGALLAVAYPVLSNARHARPGEQLRAEETLDELVAQRDAAFQAIRDLDFDRQVGKITEDDYAVFAANLRQVAANSLRAIDQWEQKAAGELEAALSSGRKAGAGRPTVTCPKCQKANAADDAFCTRCGADLRAARAKPAAAKTDRAACPKCGKAIQRGDRFCPRCGSAVEKFTAQSS